MHMDGGHGMRMCVGKGAVRTFQVRVMRCDICQRSPWRQRVEFRAAPGAPVLLMCWIPSRRYSALSWEPFTSCELAFQHSIDAIEAQLLAQVKIIKDYGYG